MTPLLTKQFTFEMAHALPGYDGKCANIHGHSYHLEVTIQGLPIHDPTSPKNGMVADFGDIKQLVQQHILNHFDHALVLPRHSTLAQTLADQPNLIPVDFQPTTENLLQHFATLLQPHLPPHIQLHHLRLSETNTSYAELQLAPNNTTTQPSL